MASQQVLFAETIAGMKKAFKRRAYESDSDSEIESYSNRGHKLQKRARFAHQGQLVPTNGPSSYREYVEYAGVRRPIIHRNPPLIDEEGYEVESDEEDEDRIQEAEAAAAELNPYANIQIEMRHLLTALCGDYTWVPCSMMVRPSDIELYTDDHVARHLLSLSKAQPQLTNGGTQQENGISPADPVPDMTGDRQVSDKDAAEDADITMTDAETVGADDSHLDIAKDDKDETTETTEKDGAVQSSEAQNEGQEPVDKGPSKGRPENGVDQHVNKGKEVGAGPAQAAAADDTRRENELAEAIAQDVSMTSGGQDPTFVHPMFIAPSGAKPDRDVGLPEQEAEDIRRLLALYVQKQEEVCRGARRLFLGLLKADQLRKSVLHWSKAEAHSGANRDMSDGEDWYDKEEWGLTEDLKKGQDEEEEDTQTTGKKTRNRK
ncbi:hypothetical protein LRP88_05223 [Fusarium phalaenopsidis]